LISECCEKCSNYDELKAVLSNTPIAAPTYFIICGKEKGQGSVITRNYEVVDHMWNLDENSWALFQTNIDCNLSDEEVQENILWSIERRQVIVEWYIFILKF
jgi:hypothetical protein